LCDRRWQIAILRLKDTPKDGKFTPADFQYDANASAPEMMKAMMTPYQPKPTRSKATASRARKIGTCGP
jgi:hypothetical protein